MVHERAGGIEKVQIVILSSKKVQRWGGVGGFLSPFWRVGQLILTEVGVADMGPFESIVNLNLSTSFKIHPFFKITPNKRDSKSIFSNMIIIMKKQRFRLQL